MRTKNPNADPEAEAVARYLREIFAEAFWRYLRERVPEGEVLTAEQVDELRQEFWDTPEGRAVEKANQRSMEALADIDDAARSLGLEPIGDWEETRGGGKLERDGT